MSTVYGLIESEEGHLTSPESVEAVEVAPMPSVRQMCAWAGVSRSGYLAWRQHVPSATATRRAQLTAVVTAIFTESDSTYGYRRVHAEAARRGWHADPHTIRAIMADEGLEAVCSRKRGPRTTVPAAGDFPDLVNRDFTAEQIGVKLVGDITYIDTWEGWVYLATVLDCASKKVVGYALADHMRTELITDALKMAARNIPIQKSITIFHSDRGSQYMSREFKEYCDQIGIRRSVGRTGICYDNAWAESFNAALKVERVNRTAYPTKAHAIRDVTKWIELRYNQTRLHSTLGYRTPNEVETELLALAA